MNSFQFGHRVGAILPCPGFGVEPSEIPSKCGRGGITKRSEDEQEGVGGIPPAEASGKHPIEAASPRRAIREIIERRHPLEPPENVRTGNNIPENSDEGTAQRGGGVTAYEALQLAGIIDAQSGGSEPIAAQVNGHTSAEHRGGEFVREDARITSGDGRKSAKPRGQVDRARQGTRAKTN